MKRKYAKSGWKFKPGMYEGITPQQAGSQVASAPDRPDYKNGTSAGLTMFHRPKGGWGRGGMK